MRGLVISPAGTFGMGKVLIESNMVPSGFFQRVLFSGSHRRIASEVCRQSGFVELWLVVVQKTGSYL